MRTKLIRAERLTTRNELIRQTKPVSSVKLCEVSRAGELITARLAGSLTVETFNAKDKVQVKS